jgi:hypothetical protein
LIERLARAGIFEEVCAQGIYQPSYWLGIMWGEEPVRERDIGEVAAEGVIFRIELVRRT